VRRGARVAIFGRDEQTLAAPRRELGETTLAFAGDVTRRDDLRRFFDAVAHQFDRLDGVFVNAGTAAYALIDAVTEEHIASLLDVNFSCSAHYRSSDWRARALTPGAIGSYSVLGDGLLQQGTSQTLGHACA
jgi:NAD(P)-dependent dehydrogenase (short-subunit alcohol dehydrogenase family)